MSELESDSAQRCLAREWVAERVGWGVFAMMLAAGMAGLLGPGVLTHARQTSATGTLAVQFDQVVRSDAPAVIVLSIENVPQDEPVTIAFSRAFLDDTKRDVVSPLPLSQSQTATDILWHFAPSKEGQRFQVTIRYEYDSAGSYTPRATFAGEQVNFPQLVLP
jgi:hypothetical protein